MGAAADARVAADHTNVAGEPADHARQPAGDAREPDCKGYPLIVASGFKALASKRRSATLRRQSAKPQWDVGVGPRSTSILKF